MERVLIGAITVTLLSGCATGALMSPGPLDYAAIDRSIRCEIVKVYQEDQKQTNLFDRIENDGEHPYWAATYEIVEQGKVDTRLGIVASLPKFLIGTVPVTSSLSLGSAKNDTATVSLGKDKAATLIDDGICLDGHRQAAFGSRLGLVEWYRSVVRSAAGGGIPLIKQLEYKREIILTGFDGSISAANGSPVIISPSAGASAKAIANLTVRFTRKPPDVPPKGVDLSDETLAKLAAIISGGGPSKVVGSRKKQKRRIVKISREPSVPPLLERIENQRIQQLNDRLDKLER